MTREQLAGEIAGVAVLEEPVRRALYRYVARRGVPVGRDEAARAARVSRALAGFHLDRLAAEGLLDVSFRRLSGRQGPGAGRPAKLYRRSDRELAVSVPPRRYELAARIFAAVLARAGSGVKAELNADARRVGRGLGAGVREESTRAGRRAAGGRASGERLLGRLEAALADEGFEPAREADGTIRLGNCPFHLLASQQRELVCGMNLALIEGVLSGARARGLKAVLDPRPGMCCVALRQSKQRTRG
jgi:predicted ArsR family transcriptional regulator